MINFSITIKRIKAILFFVFAINLILNYQLHATNYYVDPVNGDMADDGSKEDPWKTLAEVFTDGKTFEAGDTLFLLSGHHGKIKEWREKKKKKIK